MYNANNADTYAELGSFSAAYLALCTMPNMPRHMLNWEVLGLHIWHCVQCQICHYPSMNGSCIFGIVYNAKYAETHAELGSIRTAYLALCIMPNMPLS